MSVARSQDGSDNVETLPFAGRKHSRLPTFAKHSRPRVMSWKSRSLRLKAIHSPIRRETWTACAFIAIGRTEWPGLSRRPVQKQARCTQLQKLRTHLMGIRVYFVISHRIFRRCPRSNYSRRRAHDIPLLLSTRRSTLISLREQHCMPSRNQDHSPAPPSQCQDHQPIPHPSTTAGRSASLRTPSTPAVPHRLPEY